MKKKQVGFMYVVTAITKYEYTIEKTIEAENMFEATLKFANNIAVDLDLHYDLNDYVVTDVRVL